MWVLQEVSWGHRRIRSEACPLLYLPPQAKMGSLYRLDFSFRGMSSVLSTPEGNGWTLVQSWSDPAAVMTSESELLYAHG